MLHECISNLEPIERKTAWKCSCEQCLQQCGWNDWKHHCYVRHEFCRSSNIDFWDADLCRDFLLSMWTSFSSLDWDANLCQNRTLPQFLGKVSSLGLFRSALDLRMWAVPDLSQIDRHGNWLSSCANRSNYSTILSRDKAIMVTISHFWRCCDNCRFEVSAIKL